MHTGTHMHTQTNTHTQTHTHIHTQTHIGTHIYTHTHKHTHRDPHTGTHTCTQAHKHTGTHKHTHTKQQIWNLSEQPDCIVLSKKLSLGHEYDTGECRCWKMGHWNTFSDAKYRVLSWSRRPQTPGCNQSYSQPMMKQCNHQIGQNTYFSTSHEKTQDASAVNKSRNMCFT